MQLKLYFLLFIISTLYFLFELFLIKYYFKFNFCMTSLRIGFGLTFLLIHFFLLIRILETIWNLLFLYFCLLINFKNHLILFIILFLWPIILLQTVILILIVIITSILIILWQELIHYCNLHLLTIHLYFINLCLSLK